MVVIQLVLRADGRRVSLHQSSVWRDDVSDVGSKQKLSIFAPATQLSQLCFFATNPQSYLSTPVISAILLSEYGGLCSSHFYNYDRRLIDRLIGYRHKLFTDLLFFSARYAAYMQIAARYMLSPIRLSVRPSVTRVDQSKRLKLGSCNFHHKVAPWL